MPSFPNPAIRVGVVRIHSSVSGTLFHHSQLVTLLKSINGAGQVLIVQHSDQLSDCFVGITRPRFNVIRR
jgi:hypothetical protein